MTTVTAATRRSRWLFFGLALVLGCLGFTVPRAHAATATFTRGVSRYHVQAPSGDHCALPLAQRAGAGVVLGSCRNRYYWELVRVRNGCWQLRNPGGRLALSQTRSRRAALGSPRDLHATCFFVADNFIDKARGLDELHFAGTWLTWNTAGRGGTVTFTVNSSSHTQWNPYF